MLRLKPNNWLVTVSAHTYPELGLYTVNTSPKSRCKLGNREHERPATDGRSSRSNRSWRECHFEKGLRIHSVLSCLLPVVPENFEDPFTRPQILTPPSNITLNNTYCITSTITQQPPPRNNTSIYAKWVPGAMAC